jgi:gas vesicle protein
MSSGKLFLGILAGVTTGLLLGILFAPDAKKSVLQKPSKKEKDLVNEAK